MVRRLEGLVNDVTRRLRILCLNVHAGLHPAMALPRDPDVAGVILLSEDLHRVAYNAAFDHFQIRPHGNADIANWYAFRTGDTQSRAQMPHTTAYPCFNGAGLCDLSTSVLCRVNIMTVCPTGQKNSMISCRIALEAGSQRCDGTLVRSLTCSSASHVPHTAFLTSEGYVALCKVSQSMGPPAQTC